MANFLARQRAALTTMKCWSWHQERRPLKLRMLITQWLDVIIRTGSISNRAPRCTLEMMKIFARITQAYETLTNLETRASYDRTVCRTQRIEQQGDKTKDRAEDEFEGQSRPMQADHHFREGTSALEQGRFDSAMKHLASAVRLAPKEAQFSRLLRQSPGR